MGNGRRTVDTSSDCRFHPHRRCPHCLGGEWQNRFTAVVWFCQGHMHVNARHWTEWRKQLSWTVSFLLHRPGLIAKERGHTIDEDDGADGRGGYQHGGVEAQPGKVDAYLLSKILPAQTMHLLLKLAQEDKVRYTSYCPPPTFWSNAWMTMQHRPFTEPHYAKVLLKSHNASYLIRSSGWK